MTKTAAASNTAFAEGSPIDILLFGFNKKSGNMGMSLTAAQTASSNETATGIYSHMVPALRHLIKVLPFTSFSIATVGPDGNRLYSKEALKNAGGMANLNKETLLQTKIQLLLDQRKPPTEELPSLC